MRRKDETMDTEPARESSFYLGFLFLPKPKREALQTVYGFCRKMDDIVDSGAFKPDEARRMLDFWRGEVGCLYAGKPTQELSLELLPYVQAYRLPQRAFLDLIGGVEMDLTKNRYETFEELEPYLYGVAVTVGLLCVEIFGHEHTSPENMREYCKSMGYAFQLTNILRDVGADLKQGRIYLPQRELREAGCPEQSILRRESTSGFRTVMERQYERAKAHYARARSLLDPRDRRAMAPAQVMAQVYEDVLDRLRNSGYPSLSERVSLPAWRKAAAVIRAVVFSYGPR